MVEGPGISRAWIVAVITSDDAINTRNRRKRRLTGWMLADGDRLVIVALHRDARICATAKTVAPFGAAVQQYRASRIVPEGASECSRGDGETRFPIDSVRRLPIAARLVQLPSTHRAAARPRQSVKTTVLAPFSSTRSARWWRTARASTRRSISRPLRTSVSGLSAWVTCSTSCAMIGPSSRSAVT